ncbi:hypothetical protein KAR91_10975 [Candidatus Pacearchaeota archaeon]|nr:hypothetical protein [Candidatus Pacearchaeota archaeon]
MAKRTGFKVFNDRNNVLDLAVVQDGVPITATFVTKVAVVIFDMEGTKVDSVNSADDADAFDLTVDKTVAGATGNPIRILRLILGKAGFTAADRYKADIVLYSSSYTDGFVWGQIYLNVLADNDPLV